MFPPIKHPCSGIVVGPSMSGKTELTLEIIRNLADFYDKPIRRVHWYHGNSAADGNSLPIKSTLPENVDITFLTTLPTEFVNEIADEPLLVIIDDLMDIAMNSLAVSQLYTKGVHHQQISVILLSQNIYNPGKYSRNISLNSSFYILFRNLRDMQQIHKFFQQMCGSNSKAMLQVYKDATSRPHGYLFVDFSQGGHNLLRLRTNLFGGKPICYCPSDELNSLSADGTNNNNNTKTTRCGQVYALRLE